MRQNVIIVKKQLQTKTGIPYHARDDIEISCINITIRSGGKNTLRRRSKKGQSCSKSYTSHGNPTFGGLTGNMIWFIISVSWNTVFIQVINGACYTVRVFYQTLSFVSCNLFFKVSCRT